MRAFEIADLMSRRAAQNRLYLEFLRVPGMSLGIYTLAAGGTDPQSPHGEDEVYYVVHGRARVLVEGEDRPVEPGSIVFVPAGAEHRFHAIEQELTLLVCFAPAEGDTANG